MDSILSVHNKDFTRDGQSLRKFLETPQKQKLFTRTIDWNWENLVKIYHGIIEPQHLIGPRQMGLQKEQCAE